jgi:hypothetical protein
LVEHNIFFLMPALIGSIRGLVVNVFLSTCNKYSTSSQICFANEHRLFVF